MTREECEDFVAKAVALAVSRDNASGGVIRLAAIHENGVDRRTISGDAHPKFSGDA